MRTSDWLDSSCGACSAPLEEAYSRLSTFHASTAAADQMKPFTQAVQKICFWNKLPTMRSRSRTDARRSLQMLGI